MKQTGAPQAAGCRLCSVCEDFRNFKGKFRCFKVSSQGLDVTQQK